MGEIKETHKRCIVNGLEHDWYDIIDLEEWMNK